MASAELLKQIQAGKSLKKTVTNDRSGPTLDSGKGGGRSPSVAPVPPSGAGNNVPMAGPPQLGALFAGGMPKLRPAGHSLQETNATQGDVPRVVMPATKAVAPSPARAAKPPAVPRVVPPPPARATPAPPPRPAPATPARAIPTPLPPAIPTRVAPTLSRAAPSLPGRHPPPPPPPRPLSSASLVPDKAAAAAPSTRIPLNGSIPAPPARVRVLSESAAPDVPVRAPPPPPTRSSPITPRPTATPPLQVSSGSTSSPPIPPPVRRVTPSVSPIPPQRNVASVPSRKIPSPPPSSGSHTFPINDFPPPRDFCPVQRHYNSGHVKGSNFDTTVL